VPLVARVPAGDSGNFADDGNDVRIPSSATSAPPATDASVWPTPGTSGCNTAPAGAGAGTTPRNPSEDTDDVSASSTLAPDAIVNHDHQLDPREPLLPKVKSRRGAILALRDASSTQPDPAAYLPKSVIPALSDRHSPPLGRHQATAATHQSGRPSGRRLAAADTSASTARSDVSGDEHSIAGGEPTRRLTRTRRHLIPLLRLLARSAAEWQSAAIPGNAGTGRVGFRLGKAAVAAVPEYVALLTGRGPSIEASRFSRSASDRRHGNSARISSADYLGRFSRRSTKDEWTGPLSSRRRCVTTHITWRAVKTAHFKPTRAQ